MLKPTRALSEMTNFSGELTMVSVAQTDETGVETLINRVGERVRKARNRNGMSRRALSEKSLVSPRYLAQLEAGKGNISIALLQRIACALDFRIEWLLCEDDPWESETLAVADLFRNAAPARRRQVLEILRQHDEIAHRASRICLIGLRGAGKSTLGAMAGAALEVPFVELGSRIEEHCGMPVNEVLALYGQEGYRALESRAVAEIIETCDSVILAVAGGIVTTPDTYAVLLNHFHTIWLKASPQEHMDRVKAQGDLRPMAGNPQAMEQLKAILSSREPQYEKALLKLDTTGRSLKDSLKELLFLINRHVPKPSP